MRPFPWLTSVALAAALSVGCMTYQQDLDRAQRHYDKQDYEKALALFRVLENDMDSFDAAGQAKYAYLRGMTDYRLSQLAQPGTGAADPRRGYRDNSRHWLAVSAAIEKAHPGGITEDEKSRLAEALQDLNKDWASGAEEAMPAASGTPAAGSAAPDAPPAEPAK